MSTDNSSELDFVVEHSPEECIVRLQALQEPLNALPFSRRKWLKVATEQLDADICRFWLGYYSESTLERTEFSTLAQISGEIVKSGNWQTRIQINISDKKITNISS